MIVYAAIFRRERCRGKKNKSSGGGDSVLVQASYSLSGGSVRDRYDEEIAAKLGTLPEGGGRIEPAPASEEPAVDRLYGVAFPEAVYVIVTSPDYPAGVAIWAVDELCEADRRGDGGKAPGWTRKWRRGNKGGGSDAARRRRRLRHCVSVSNRYSLREPGCLLYDYESDPEQFRVYEDDIRAYLEARDRQEWEARAAQMQDEVSKVKQQAEDNLLDLTRSVENCQQLLKKSEDLREQARVFYKKARRARGRRTRRIVKYGGVAIGAATFVLMGGLDQPILFLADTLLEKIAGQGVDAAVGAAFGYFLAWGAVESYFWAQTRVFRLA